MLCPTQRQLSEQQTQGLAPAFPCPSPHVLVKHNTQRTDGRGTRAPVGKGTAKWLIWQEGEMGLEDHEEVNAEVRIRRWTLFHRGRSP